MRLGDLRSRASRLGAAAGLAIGLAALAGSAQAQTNLTFVSASPSGINVYPVLVAIGEGYFKEEGINVRWEALNGSGAILQALAANQAQIGRPGPAPVMQARARGVDVVFLYNSLPRSSFGILVKEGSAYKTPDQLKGKVIGVGTADGAEVGFTRAILADYGLKENVDFKFIPVGDGGTATAGFLRGDIEAYAGSLADQAILNYRGMKVRDITPEKFQTLFGNGYVAMKSFIDANPKVIEGFGRALVRATKFTEDPKNRETVLKHLAAGMPSEVEDKGYANSLLDAVLAKGKPMDPSKGIGYQPPEHWEDWHKSAVATGTLKAPLDDVKKAYTNQFVDAWNKPK